MSVAAKIDAQGAKRARGAQGFAPKEALRAAAQPYRLPDRGIICRNQTLPFRFNGETFEGFEGDTLAAALLAAGVKLVGRSFKYHRPRGIVTAGPEEPNGLVELRSGAWREPNTRSTTTELFDGLEARSQNCWPSVELDLGAVNGLLSPFFVAGFYYKTFMWPAPFWEMVYEPLIRHAAGLGRASRDSDPDRYEKAYAFCDVLVIGAGPSGLAAALAAGRAGARVIVCDEDFRLGGRLNAETFDVSGLPGSVWADLTTAELASMPNVRLMVRTAVFGGYDGRTYGAIERVSDHCIGPQDGRPRQRYWKIVARQTVLASGAIERPIAFGGNDRPGVMLAASVRTYLTRYGVVPGRRPAVFTATDDGWLTAIDLCKAGIEPPTVVDARPEVDASLAASAAALGCRVILGGVVIQARGRPSLSTIEIRHRAGESEKISCDLLAVSGGWNPNLALTTHLGGKPTWSDAKHAFVPGATTSGITPVGAANGAFGLGVALRQGFQAGAAAARVAGASKRVGGCPTAGNEGEMVGPCFLVEGARSRAFVDFQHDVTVRDIALAEQEGFRSVEHLKRYTTLGMGTDQGKLSNVVGLAIMAELTGRSIPDVGSTTFRPPYAPVAIGALAGPHRGREFRPERLSAGHKWAADRGATFVAAGQWLRPQWFSRPGEANWLETVNREVLAVRNAVGVCDVSTLGKIEVRGADAAVFLDRVYINTFSTLAVCKARYGVMLREDGHVFDDGTTARLGDDRFVMSTTTANAGAVMQHLEHARQVIWPDLEVQLTSATDQWSQFAIAGPQSRTLLQRLLGDALDVSNDALPFLGSVEFEWAGVQARLFRISFSGELAYELAVPATVGQATIEAVFAAGVGLGVTPYGTEALSVMRIEKGHVAGPELNGQTTAGDLRLGRMMSKKKDFIGRVLSQRPGLTDPNRPTLVGIRPVKRGARLRAGAHLLPTRTRQSLAADQGHITSAAFSPMLGHWIALGLLVRGEERHGERLVAHDPLRGRDVQVEVCSPVFFDPGGGRLHG